MRQPPKRPNPHGGKPKAKTAETRTTRPTSTASSQDLKSDQPLPRVQEMQSPTVEQLHKSPVDWLVLKGPNKGNELVVVVKPVFPRPDTLKKLQTALDELRHRPAPTTPAEREKRAAQRNELSKLVVTLPGEGEGQLYEIPTNVIDSIIYHEDSDHPPRRHVDRRRKLPRRVRVVVPLARQAPDWKGARKTRRSGSCSSRPSVPLQTGDLESALTSLEELARSRTATTRSCRSSWAKSSTS